MKIAWMIVGVCMVIGTSSLAPGQGLDGKEKKNRDSLRIAVQEICPVSGEKLGSMGDPIKVKVGEEIVFLCCKGCVQQKIEPKHWATIHNNFAMAQRICPVMKHKLPKNPKWTIVGGQIIFVCCPPCTKKIVADPKTYLARVDELYTLALADRKNGEPERTR